MLALHLSDLQSRSEAIATSGLFNGITTFNARVFGVCSAFLGSQHAEG